MWITDRTQADVERVQELFTKAKSGEWSNSEQKEWISGMKGALNYSDFNRIESGIGELAAIVGASVTVKTDWTLSGYMTVADATRWLANVVTIRNKCSGPALMQDTPTSMNQLTFATMNQIEQILFDIETLAKTHVTFAGEYACGEGQYGF